jgi:hypothetical protein
VCAACAGRGPSGTRIVIRDADTGRAFASLPAAEGTVFAIEFLHSVNKSPVRDTFCVQGAAFAALSTRFQAFGAGMQSDLAPGERLAWDGEALELSGFDRRFSELRFVLAPATDHVLYIEGRELSLKGLCGANAHIVIQVEGGN